MDPLVQSCNGLFFCCNLVKVITILFIGGQYISDFVAKRQFVGRRKDPRPFSVFGTDPDNWVRTIGCGSIGAGKFGAGQLGADNWVRTTGCCDNWVPFFLFVFFFDFVVSFGNLTFHPDKTSSLCNFWRVTFFKC